MLARERSRGRWRTSVVAITVIAVAVGAAAAIHARATHALKLIGAMWNSAGSYFYIGTGLDGKTINKDDPTPEDVQTWSYLATGLAQYQGSPTLARTSAR